MSPEPAEPSRDPGSSGKVALDRHMVLDQLGGWRGMVDATLPTLAFIVGNSVAGLRPGIWAAGVTAVLVFVVRLVRRESVQQAFSGLFGVAIAVFIAARSGEARNFFVPGLIRNIVIGVVLAGSTLVRWPLVGVVAEFLAPSHLGGMSGHRLPSLRGRTGGRGRGPAQPDVPQPDGAQVDGAGPGPADDAGRTPDAPAELHWRRDRRVLRAYTWLTLMWAGTFLVRAAVTGFFYVQNEVGLLGTASLVLGLPVSAAALLVTLWVVSRLHRHRTPDPVP